MTTSHQSNKQNRAIELTPTSIDRSAKNYDNMFAQGILDAKTHRKLSSMCESLKPRVERVMEDIADINEINRKLHAIVHEALLKYSENKK